jgi:hypothetical protein
MRGVEAVEKPLFADVISPCRAIFHRHVSIVGFFRLIWSLIAIAVVWVALLLAGTIRR